MYIYVKANSFTTWCCKAILLSCVENSVEKVNNSTFNSFLSIKHIKFSTLQTYLWPNC